MTAERVDWEARSCKGDYHPLEIFPIFRRVPSTFARNLAYTFIWNCALGLGFWVVAMALSPRRITLARATEPTKERSGCP